MKSKANTSTSQTPPITIVVTDDIRTFFLEANIGGMGGFQSLCRQLADRLRASTILKLTPDEFARIVRYASVYGDGGYQAKLRKIVAQWAHQNLNRLVA